MFEEGKQFSVFCDELCHSYHGLVEGAFSRERKNLEGAARAAFNHPIDRRDSSDPEESIVDLRNSTNL